eukprot:3996550-Amphidinium_carterae.2
MVHMSLLCSSDECKGSKGLASATCADRKRKRVPEGDDAELGPPSCAGRSCDERPQQGANENMQQIMAN